MTRRRSISALVMTLACLLGFQLFTVVPQLVVSPTTKSNLAEKLSEPTQREFDDLHEDLQQILGSRLSLTRYISITICPLLSIALLGCMAWTRSHME